MQLEREICDGVECHSKLAWLVFFFLISIWIVEKPLANVAS